MSIDLVPFSKEFISNDYINWLNDSKLMQYSEQRHKVHTKKSCEDYYESFSNSKNILFAVLNKKNKEHIGNINAYIDIENKLADIGIIIGKTGCGYGYLAWMEMINILFYKKHIRKITAGAMAINKPIIKIFIKSGMKYEYTKKDYYIYKNQLIDLIGYCIFKPAEIGD